MSTSAKFILSIITIWLSFSVFAFGETTYSFTTIGVPYPGGAMPLGISGESIVGRWMDAGFDSHGFLYDGNSYTSFDFPNSPMGGELTGISGEKIIEIVTNADSSKGGLRLSFLKTGATVTPVVFPGSVETEANGISGDHIVGSYFGQNATHGFHYDGAKWESLDVPGASTTIAYGIDTGLPVNRIVGIYYIGNSPTKHSFLYDGSSFTTIQVPGSEVTEVLGMSDGKAVGTYTVNGHPQDLYNFIYDGTNYFTIAAPGAFQAISGKGGG